jgi:hypothetical protein
MFRLLKAPSIERANLGENFIERTAFEYTKYNTLLSGESTPTN